jgi:hypothetical protein
MLAADILQLSASQSGKADTRSTSAVACVCCMSWPQHVAHGAHCACGVVCGVLLKAGLTTQASLPSPPLLTMWLIVPTVHVVWCVACCLNKSWPESTSWPLKTSPAYHVAHGAHCVC